MTEHPILFSAPMIQAILAGRKTQTRRIIKVQPSITTDTDASWRDSKCDLWRNSKQYARDCCPYGSIGDRLWVRETSAVYSAAYSECGIVYRADHATGDLSKGDGGYNFHQFSDDPEQAAKDRKWAEKHGGNEKWIPSIYMPRFASRINLEITGVRVERLQEITEADAKAEGCEPWPFDKNQPMTSGELGSSWPYRGGYAVLWDEINDERATWKSNPYVWVVEFKKV